MGSAKSVIQILERSSTTSMSCREPPHSTGVEFQLELYLWKNFRKKNTWFIPPYQLIFGALKKPAKNPAYNSRCEGFLRGMLQFLCKASRGRFCGIIPERIAKNAVDEVEHAAHGTTLESRMLILVHFFGVLPNDLKKNMRKPYLTCRLDPLRYLQNRILLWCIEQIYVGFLW